MTTVIKSAGSPCHAKIAAQQCRNLQYPALPGNYENPRQRRILMKITVAIVSVAALVGTIACGNSDTPPTPPDNEPTARPTIEALIPIATPANTLTLITPTPGNTPAPTSQRRNPATPAATVASPTPAPANAATHPTAAKPAGAGGLVMTAKPTATPPLRRRRHRPQLPARR